MKKICMIIIVVLVIIGVVASIVISKDKTLFTGSIKSDIKVESLESDKYKNNSLFGKYYKKSLRKLKNMSIDQKIGQLLLVRYPEEEQKDVLKKYQFGGYLFFAKDFRDKTKDEVISMINDLQAASKIPILTAVDEEGGIVVRVSSNPNLRSERFLSSQKLYELGGFDKIKEDTIEKSNLLKELGLNLNLAPVVDVSTNKDDYMYERSIGQNSDITAEYAKTVISASKGSGVSYTLKHFPGYGNNIDTHTASSIDNRSLDDIEKNDLPPFKAGIEAKAEAILVSHNIVDSIDNKNPASISPKVHKLLRKNLNFSGIVITDDLEMGATKDIEDKSVKAILADNDLLIVTDYLESINEIKNAINNKIITENDLDKKVLKILEWKYYKKLLS